MPEGAFRWIEGDQPFGWLIVGFALVDVDQVILFQGHKVEIIRPLRNIFLKLSRAF